MSRKPGKSETAPPATTTGEQPATGAMDAATGLINKQEENRVLVSEYDGADVYDSNGEQIGEIADLILDDQNKLVGFVVATGGFLGVAEHSVGVALGELTELTDPEGFTIATSREQLEAAPEFLTLEAAEAAARGRNTSAADATAAPRHSGASACAAAARAVDPVSARARAHAPVGGSGHLLEFAKVPPRRASPWALALAAAGLILEQLLLVLRLRHRRCPWHLRLACRSAGGSSGPRRLFLTRDAAFQDFLLMRRCRHGLQATVFAGGGARRKRLLLSHRRSCHPIAEQ